MTTQCNQGNSDNRGAGSMDKDKQQRDAATKSGQSGRGDNSDSRGQGNTRGGDSDQHAKAGRQSHKNS